MRSFALAFSLLCTVAGCDLYYQKPPPPPPCYEAPPAQTQLRDPQTGQCQNFGGGCGACGPCAEGASGGTAIAIPDWATCNGTCEGLDEATCLSTQGCHAAYLDPPAGSGQAPPTFLGCWDLAPASPAPGGSCTALDAQSCSERGDCSPVYQDFPEGQSSQRSFVQCIQENPETCSTVDITCPTGTHCEDSCTPCNSVGCSATCTPTCVPTTGPGDCTGTVTCRAAPPACPAGTTPGIASGCYSGYCIPVGDCGVNGPGGCAGSVECNSAPPACPAGTEPGIADNCWTGYCIPDASC